MKEIIKITAEKKMSLKKIQRANECKSWFFEKINKIDEPLTRLMKKKRGKTQIYKIRNKRGKITMDTKEMQRIVRKYEQLYANKLDHLGEIDKFIETYNFGFITEGP